ncbi:MAG TPA: aldo/keto reductase [Lachnospiraceae bacterium]|nr:aldo/keto reductase [Lachnospiraceae bacterium]
MEKRKMDKLGIETSLLGFGCMRFPTLQNGEINEEESQKLLDKAIGCGVNYIDTAYPYHNGKSETFLGKALKKHKRDSYYLATKLPTWLVHKKEDVERLFEEQLSKLQTDYVDFYLLHAMGKERWDEMVKLGVIECCEKLKAEGRIKYFGFSFHDSYEAFEEIINARDWDFCQIQLNYMDTEEQAGLKGYQLAAGKEIPIVVMEPVKGGSLAKFAADIEHKYQKLDSQASVASYALRWVGSLPGVKVILSGMSTMEQVEDNLNTFKNFKPLSEKEDKTIIEVVSLLNSRVQNGCTGCRYCMPCPAGVDIPENFKVWNTYHMYQNYDVVKWSWEMGLGEKHQAKSCIKCGKCEALCPQKLSIRKDLEKVQQDMDQREMIL